MVEEIRLSNGLTVVAEEAPWQRGVSLGLFVRGAAVDEPPGQEGIAHLLEHLVFRGTRGFSSTRLAAAIEEDGGELNAYTTKEYTCLWGRTLPEATERHIELLAELFLRPSLRGRDLGREVQVVEEEYALWRESPEEFACDLLEEEIFAGSPLQRRVLGDPAALRRLRGQDLRAFHAANWRPERAVLACTGPVGAGRVAKAAQALFGEVAAEPPGRPRQATVAQHTLAPSRVAQVHLAIGGRALPFNTPGLAAEELLVQEFGGGPSSRLFQRLREEEVLSYGVYSYTTAYRQAGMWGAYADLPPDGLRRGLQAMLEEAAELRAARLSPRRLERMRKGARGALLLAQDSPFARVERHALQVLLEGRARPLADELRELEAVDARGVRAAAQRLFAPEGLRCVALLPDGRVLRGDVRDIEEAEVEAG